MTMTSRRQFLQLSLAAGSFGSALALPATTRNQPTVYKVLHDTRHPSSAALAWQLMQQLPTLTDAPLLGMAGDITPFWYGELHTAWRQTPVAIAGVTEAGPLFCLEQLGREHGLRVAWRSAVPQQPLVAWLLVPAKTV